MEKIMSIRMFNFFVSLCFAFLLYNLNGCSSNKVQQDVPQAVNLKSSSFYIHQAKSLSGKKKNSTLLLASQAAIKEQNFKIASDALNQIDVSNLSQNDKIVYYNQLSKVNFQNKNYIKSANNLASANSFIDDISQKKKNWNKILEILHYADIFSLTNSNNNIYQSDLSPWINLALIQKEYADNLEVLQTKINQWKSDNSSLLNVVPDNINTISSYNGGSAQNILLYLPLTGKYAKQGQDILSGFKYKQSKSLNNTYQINTIDSNKIPVSQLPSIIQSQNIDVLVGPLQKGNVSNLVRSNSVSIPTILLNTSNEPKNNSSLCTFTLSPENQAAQVAQKMFKENKFRPIIIVPDSTFGYRSAQAFKNSWLKMSAFSPKVLKIKSNNQLQSKLKTLFKGKANTPDSVFFIGNKSQLLLTKAYIELYLPAGINQPQIYSNSSTNILNSSQSELKDLQNVKFIDLSILMPGLKPSDYPVNNINDLRVSALGVDSFSLISALQEMKLNPYIQINGATGKLSLGNDCNIETQYSWGQVRSGQIIKQ